MTQVENTSGVPARCALALKEWAVAIEALGTGRTALIIRKGGIREESKRFELRYDECLLFPSFEHQQADLLRPEHAGALGHVLAETPSPDALRFTHYARVHDAFAVREQAELDALAPHHIWSDAYASARLRWRPSQALTGIVLRVWRLAEPVSVPWRPEYAGCKSWLTLLDEAPLPAATPAMTDDAFAAEAAAIRAALAGAQAAPQLTNDRRSA
jgi:hypothetical protein